MRKKTKAGAAAGARAKAREPQTERGVHPDQVALYTHLLIARQRAVTHAHKKLMAMAQEARAAGVSWGAVRAALRQFEQSAETRARAAVAAGEIYLAIGAPVSMDVFDQYEPLRNDTVAEAERRGRFAAVRHEPCEAPYSMRSREGRAWVESWTAFMALVDAYNTRFAAREAEVFQAPAEKKHDGRRRKG